VNALRSTLLRGSSAALIALLAACSGGGDGTPTDPAPGPNVTVTLTLGGANVEVTQGENAATVQLAINRPSGFTGTVNLAATAPAGITATLTPPALTGTATTTTLNVQAAAGVAAGDYAVTVTATGTGVTTSSLVVPLVVKTAAPPPPPPPAGSYTLAVAPNAVSVQAGQQGSAEVTLTRANNFAGAVALTATGAPAGVTVGFAPASVVASTSAVTVTVGASVAPGAYPIVIRGNATGQDERTATLTLTVTAAGGGGGGGGGGNLTWNFCGSLAPLWFAVQDGTGAWQRVTASAPGVFQANITQARGGVSFVVAEDGGFTNKMYFATQAELIELGASWCPNTTVKSHAGSVAGAPTSTVFVSLGGRQVSVSTAASTAFTLANVPAGPRDLIAARNSLNLTTFQLEFDRVVLRRNVNLANNAALPSIDFGAAESFAPVNRTLTLNNTSGHLVNIVTMFETANSRGAGSGLLQTTIPAAVSSVVWRGVPADRQQAGDRHTVVVSAIPSASVPASLNGRSLLYYTAAPQDQALTFGPLISGATFSVAATAPYVRTRLQYTPQAEYNRYFVFQAQQGGAAPRISEVNMSQGYLTGAAADLLAPDFSSVSGWDNNWGLKVGTQLTHTFSAVGWTGGSVSGPTADGAVARSAQFGNVITP
jgi:hypothetical protein